MAGSSENEAGSGMDPEGVDDSESTVAPLLPILPPRLPDEEAPLPPPRRRINGATFWFPYQNEERVV